MGTVTKRRPVVRVVKRAPARGAAAKAVEAWETVKEDVPTVDLRTALKTAQFNGRGWAEGKVRVDLWGKGAEEVAWRATIGEVRREMDERGERGAEVFRPRFMPETYSQTGGVVKTEGGATCHFCGYEIESAENHRIVSTVVVIGRSLKRKTQLVDSHRVCPQ